MRSSLTLIFLAFFLFITSDLSAQCFGGNRLETTEGDTVVSFCVNQGVDQPVVVDPGKIATPYAYILTDENGIIQRIQTRPRFDFSGSDEGICFIYGISYAGVLNKRAVGKHIFSVELADICFEFAANRIRVEKSSVEGGEISLSDGSVLTTVCAQDGRPDSLFFQTSSPDMPYVYLITDHEGNIVDVTEQVYDFDQPGPDKSLVIGLSYSGLLLAEAGKNVYEDEMADGCFALSENMIEVLRTFVDGGTIKTRAGQEKVFTCVGDGIPDSLYFENTGTSPADYVYVITDPSGLVRGITPDGADFEAPIPGISLVHGLSYAGTLVLSIGDTVGVDRPVDGCFEWSDNTVEVIQDVPSAGEVTTLNDENMIYTCPGDGNPDVYLFTAQNASNSQYAFAFTDEQDVVLEILGGNNIDFEDYPAGTGKIYGIAYTGNFLLQAGDTITAVSLSSECFDLSPEPVLVLREMPDGGSIDFSGGGDTLEFCKGDGLSDFGIVEQNNNSQGPYLFVFTDADGNILDTARNDSIDFEFSPDGTARIYGLAYTGTVQVEQGALIDTSVLSDDCYDLSDNYLVVQPLDVDAGEVRSELGDSLVYVCAEDTSLEIISLTNNTSSMTEYVFVFLEGNTVKTLVHSDTLYLDSLDPGMYVMRGLAYTGDLTFASGDTLPQNPATSCYDWSDNELAFHYGDPFAGVVSLAGGGNVTELCSNDSDQTVHLQRSGETPTEFVWALVDQNGDLLGILNADSIDFSTAPPDTYVLYAVTGSPLPDFNIGLAFEADSLDMNQCVDVSDSLVTVVKTDITGGTIEFSDGSQISYFCPGDTISDLIGLEQNGATGDQYSYFCLDENDVIRAGTGTDSLDVSSLSAGTYRIVGVSYTGLLLPGIGDTLDEDPLSTGCSALSENILTLVGEVPEGGMVQTTEGEVELELIVGDGIPDTFTIEAIGASNTPYVYIVTDSTDKVLAILPDSTVDFEMVPPGENRVYGLAYTGELLIDGGEQIMLDPLSDDCFDLSDNAVIFHLLPDTSGLVVNQGSEFKALDGDLRISGSKMSLTLRKQSQSIASGEIRVFDLSGRMVYRKEFIQNGKRGEYIFSPVNRQGLNVYIINVVLEDGTQWSEKVIPIPAR